jgi:hypothetical protein
LKHREYNCALAERLKFLEDEVHFGFCEFTINELAVFCKLGKGSAVHRFFRAPLPSAVSIKVLEQIKERFVCIRFDGAWLPP